MAAKATYDAGRWKPSYPNIRTIVAMHRRMNGGQPCECPWCSGKTVKGVAARG